MTIMSRLYSLYSSSNSSVLVFVRVRILTGLWIWCLMPVGLNTWARWQLRRFSQKSSCLTNWPLTVRWKMMICTLNFKKVMTWHVCFLLFDIYTVYEKARLLSDLWSCWFLKLSSLVSLFRVESKASGSEKHVRTSICSVIQLDEVLYVRLLLYTV